MQLRAGFQGKRGVRGQGLQEGLAEQVAWAKATRREDHGRASSFGAEIPAGAERRGSPGGQRLTYGNLPFFPHGRYFENIPKGLDREGWTRGGLQPQKPGGYALNQPVTRLEATPTPTESLRRLHPHVGR